MPESNKKVVMLTSYCFSTVVLYNHLSKYYPIDHVITEEPMRGMALARKRIKRLGLLKVGGQVMFMTLMAPLLRMSTRKRLNEIKKKYAFDETPVPQGKITHFNSVNDEACIDLLRELNPGIVVVNGTRIISNKLLQSTNAVFINMHTGITPKYRGVHGGYWAMVNNDAKNCGVTIHKVDKGIDTGMVLYQAPIEPSPGDNFFTYPYLQFGEGIPLMKKAIDDIMADKVTPQMPVTRESKLWYHPTIWQYLYHRIFRNKK